MTHVLNGADREELFMSIRARSFIV